MNLDAETVKGIMPKAPDLWVAELLTAMAKAEINTQLRAGAFLAQIAHESGELTHVEENLNYSAERLIAVFPRKFPSKEFADRYGHQPEKIANYIYGNRMGNGDESSGDGWSYHGRGPIQLTGKDNYTHCSVATGLPIVEHPGLLIQPQFGCASACWFWNVNGLNAFADKGDMVTITKRINGGTLGLAERLAYYQKALTELT